jgi:hypothetical protein
MVAIGAVQPTDTSSDIQPLTEANLPEIVALAQMTEFA